jgi:hypothetical protein
MIGDSVTPRDRLRCVTPECWQWKLAACIIALAIVLALMCENVNAAPARDADGVTVIPSAGVTAKEQSGAAPFMLASDMPPFKLTHPLCGAGFATITQRIDTRDRFGIIVKRENVTGCANGRIVYGRKV